MYVSENKEKAVFFAWQLNRTVGMNPEPLRLKGLDPEARYRVKEINCMNTEPKSFTVTGEYLMKVGFRISTRIWEPEQSGTISFVSDFDSEVYTIEKEQAEAGQDIISES